MSYVSLSSRFLLCLIVSHLASPWIEQPLSAGDSVWPQWRGPSRDGQVEAAAWPSSLDENHLKELWRIPLGPSYSGPIVTENAVYVTETRDANREVVTALSRISGEKLWQADWDGALSVPFFAKANGDWIRSTPAFSDGHLYVGGMRDVLVCLDASDGHEVWRVDFPLAFKSPLPSFGFVCSQLVDGEAVYVQAGAGVVKLNKRDGSLIWKGLADKGGMFNSAFSSPVIAEICGERQLVVQSRVKLAGLSLEDGSVLWSVDVPAFRGMNILTPTVLADTIFTSSYGGGSFQFRLSRANERIEVTEVWKNEAQGYMSSPVVIDGTVYVHLRNQRLTAINPESGERYWTSRPFGKYWSMVANGSQLLALDERGDLLLIDAQRDRFELIASRHISDDPTWAHLAIAGDQIFVRTLNAAVAYQWRAAAE